MEDTVILFLDDDPNRAALMYQRMSPVDRAATMWCQTVEDAIDILKEYKSRLREVHLDHDLGGVTFVYSGRNDCGMEVVRFLEKQSAKEYANCKFICHSWNLPAGNDMTIRLTKAGYKTTRRPFGT